MNTKGSSKKDSQTPKRIIVLGVMRSGTSLTADLIRLWESNVNNPHGWMEDVTATSQF